MTLICTAKIQDFLVNCGAQKLKRARILHFRNMK